MRVAVLAVLRRRRVEVVLVAVVTAILIGSALSAATGARRSSSAMDRFLAYSSPEDVFVVPPDDGSLDMEAVNRLPQVAVAEHETYLAMVPVGPDGALQLALGGSINPFVFSPIVGPADGIARRRVVAGRDIHLDQPFEAVIDEELAADRHLSVGGHLKMAAYRGDQLQQLFGTGELPAPTGPVLDLTVVGIVRTPTDIHPDESEHTTSYGGTKDLYLTPALYERYGDQLAAFQPPVPGGAEAVRFVHGSADLDAFTAAVRALPGGSAASFQTGGSDALDSARTARRAISVETTALAALAALLAVAGLVLFANASLRLSRRATTDLVVLRAVGLRPAELLVVSAGPALIAAGLGLVLAAAIAVATSPLTPIGLGRLAEIDPGFHVDALVLGPGLAAVSIVVLASALLTARSTVRVAVHPNERAVTSRPGLADRLGRMGAPLGTTLGGHFATARRGAERVAPVRSAVVVGATAVLALVGVATYTASLDRLSTTPRDQGVTWDVTIGNPNLSQYTTDDVARLVADPRVAGVMPVAAPQSRGAVNGTAVTVAGVDVTGAVAPPVIEGRLPTHAGEVALGRRTAEQLHARVGDTVALAFDGPSTQLTVVGTALLNPGLAPTMQIGDGALITLDQLQTMQPDSPVTFLLARMRPGVDIDRAITDLSATWGPNVARPPEAPDIVNLDRVRSIPVALALALGGGAAVLLGFTLVMSVTNRRRDLGVLRAVGATRRQLRSVLVWQAVWLYLAAVLIGIPAGITVGRLAWRRIDDDLGAGVAPVIPAGRLLVVVAVGLALALVLAYLPSRLVLRDRPARSLRSE